MRARLGLFVASISLIAGTSCSRDRVEVDASTPAVHVAALATPPPDTSCTPQSFGGSDYYFCSNLRDYSTARSACIGIGFRLARIDGAGENTFIRQNVLIDRWIGGSDGSTEGTWVWELGGTTFWQGSSSGSAPPGMYANWDGGEPNNTLNQDCAEILASGRWRDERCSYLQQYVCEAIDGCPLDAEKTFPGACGCGTPDVDTDGDGTLDCNEECPNDPKRTTPGQCGCKGHPGVVAAGTACTDGLCSANDECDGEGSCGFPAECAPSSSCTVYGRDGHGYALCPHDRSWGNARASCLSVPGMDLVHVNDADEDAFLHDHLPAPAWIGGTDAASEGVWRWSDDNSQFWSGKYNGGPVGIAYANWDHDQPNDLIAQDCAVHEKFDNEWKDEQCGELYDYVCEVVDQCPLDPAKYWPGTCGCGVSDDDSDGDGFRDCNESCDDDPDKQEPGACGCGNLDVDSDGDGPLDCQEGCPGDPNKVAPGACGCGKTDQDTNVDGIADCVHCEGALLDAAWPMSGSCRGSAHRSPFVGPDEVQELWTYALDVTSRDAPTIGPGGIVYAGASTGLYAVAADGSSVVWSYPTSQPVRTSPALDAAGRLFFGADDGTVYALAASTGAFLWSFPTGSPVRASPTLAIDDGWVIVGNDAGVVYALNPSSGESVWSHVVGGSIASAPTVVFDGRVLVGSTNHFVYALHPDAGLTQAERLSWQADLGAPVRTSPVAAQVEPVVYVGTDAGQLVKLRIANGAEVWRFAAAGPIAASASLGALGAIHVVSQGGFAYMLEDRGLSAYQHWAYALAAPSPAYATVGADGLLYVGGAGYIWALRPLGDDGARLAWQHAIAGGLTSAASIRADGSLVFASPGVLRVLGAAFVACPAGSRCATYRGVNYCGHSMPGTPFTMPLACPPSGVCPSGSGCTVLFGYQFCYQACNLGD